MAYEIPGKLVSFNAAADLSTSQFRAVTLNTSGAAAVVSSTAGAAILGVLQNDPVSGQAAAVMLDGITKWKAAASTMSVGDLVACSSAGLAVPVVAGDYVVGRVVEGSSGGAGRVLTVQLTPIGTT